MTDGPVTDDLYQRNGRALCSSLATLGALVALIGFSLPWVISPVYPELFSFSLLERLLGLKPRGAGVSPEWFFVSLLLVILATLFSHSIARALLRRRLFTPATALLLTCAVIGVVGLLDFTWFNPAAPLFTAPYAPRTPGIGQAVSAIGVCLVILGNSLDLVAWRRQSAAPKSP